MSQKWSNMRRRPGPRYRELTALPRPLTGQSEKWKEKEGRRGWERETRGGWETGTGYRREERKGKEGEKERREVCPRPASAPTSTSVCKTVSHCESRRSQGTRVPQFCLR